MKYVSLFAGIGGFDLALNRQGHECVYVNEWDKYSVITYEKNFCKGTERQIPIPQERQEKIGNTRHGHNEVNGNSRHGISSPHGESDRNGSTIHPRVDTRSITDVPSTEIADHDLLVGGFPCQSFSIAGKRRGFNDTRGTLFFEIARILKDKKTKYFILENVKGLLSHDNGDTFKTIIATLDEVGYDLEWQVLNSKNFGVPQNRERVFIVGHLRGTPRPKVFPIRGDYEAIASKGGRRQPFVALTERRTEEAKRLRRMGVVKDTRNLKKLEPREDELANTATTGDIKNSSLTDGARIRRLTPLECERLQGFPDNWTEGVSDTQRYKQMGNAVTVNVVEEIVKKLPPQK